MLTLILTLCFASGALAQTLFFGKCPEVQTIPDFDPVAFNGTWYVQYTSFTFYRFAYKCEVHDYTMNSNGTGKLDGSTLVFGFYNLKWNWFIESVDPENPAKWYLDFPSLLDKLLNAPVWVLDTDYTSYAAIWNCYDNPLYNIQYAWLVTRDRNASVEVISKASSAYGTTKLNPKNFYQDDQTDCPN